MEFDSGFGSSNRLIENPKVTFIHLFFRSSAIFMYIFANWIFTSFAQGFIFIVILLAFDFWTVKNVSGRIMAGLRWWNYIDNDGNSKWVFESRGTNTSQMMISKSESSLFWFTLVLFPVLWLLFFITALFSFKFQWMVLVTIGLVLNITNLLGYIRCRFGHSQSLTSSVSNAANSYMQSQMIKRIGGMIFSSKSPPSAGQSSNVI